MPTKVSKIDKVEFCLQELGIDNSDNAAEESIKVDFLNAVQNNQDTGKSCGDALLEAEKLVVL